MFYVRHSHKWINRLIDVVSSMLIITIPILWDVAWCSIVYLKCMFSGRLWYENCPKHILSES